MQISWYGLSCFQISSKTPTGEASLVIDPYANSTGLRFPRTLSASAAACSHDEEDANNFAALQGDPFIIDTPGEYEVRGIFIYAIEALKKDEGKGHLNRIFRVELEGMQICHLGALDRVLTDEELRGLNNIDILMLPVGGGRVMTPKVAVDVIGQIEPRVVIPMSHKTKGEKEALGTIDGFCKQLGVCKREDANKLKIKKSDLPETDMLLMVLSKT